MGKEGYAVSRWHDTDEIYRRLEELIKQPIRPIKRDAMQRYLDYFENKCGNSKKMITEAKEYIPGGVQHNLAFNYPFPIVIDRAEGAYLWDADGNKYIDFLQAGGPTILGSNYEPVRKEVIKLLNHCGPVTGLFHEYELKIAKLINKHMPAVEKFRMLGSGTESVMAAIRIARLATGKKKVVKIGGAYHGWSDQMVYGLKIPGTGRFEAHGIPRECSKHTQEVKPNDIEALRKQLKKNKLRGGTACVIVEPVGPESGTRPIYEEYNKEVRRLCDDFDTILIFDEVVTGFRIGLGSAQGYFDVKPDLTIFGKVIAGGYPAAGGIGGRKDLIDHLAAGLESGKKRAYVGGTLAANPLSCIAGYYTILEIEKTNACEKAGEAGDRLTNGLNYLIDKYNLPFVAYNQGSICHLETGAAMFVKLGINILSALGEVKKRKHMMEEMGAAYLAEGIVTLAGSRLYTSLSDTDEVIDDALNKFENVFRNIDGVKTS
ncbi:aminotransferase class III-fold pyridoxal phosphate-dependent enzyme [Wukongibacter baidiensis]|uniref:aspartate aminotransferase family protein n=1 Tax=Wukongibacter baidiensis TaxID=1723361 RepID=UPI003D7FB741